MPLSPLQEGLLFHALYDESGPDLYTVQVSIEVEGQLDTTRLRVALRALLAPPQSARRLSPGGPRASDAGGATRGGAALGEEDLSGLGPQPAGARRKQCVESEGAVRFALSKPPLLRFLVCKMPAAAAGKPRHVLVLTHHHILMDGWSLPIFLNELFSLYQAGGRLGALDARAP